MTHWQLSVPASTSNLGPGFDQLGLCLSLWLDVRCQPSEGQLTVEAKVEGWPSASDDLFRRALEAAAKAPLSGWRVELSSEIPIGRGFGSTGAAVAAGLLMGRALDGDPDPDPRSLLAPGIALEGHPDNVTASLLGGLTTCVPIDGPHPPALEHRVHPSIGFAAAWPAEPLPTARARAALPEQVPFADAVENARRLPLLLAGLAQGDPDLLRLGAVDHLHERYRLPLLPGAADALDAARESGAWIANISGAGSGLVAVCPLPDRDRVAAAMADRLEHATGAATARALDVVRDRPRVVQAKP